jgi:hypothetical protein
MKKYEVILHVREGYLESTIEFLGSKEGVELAGMNFIVTEPLSALLPKQREEAAVRPSKKKRRTKPVTAPTKKPIKKAKRRKYMSYGKGELENQVLEAAVSIGSNFTMNQLYDSLPRLDGGQVQRAISRMRKKGEVKMMPYHGEGPRIYVVKRQLQDVSSEAAA